MLNFYKNKGISLIELMVSVGLGLILILSMLAFYSISLQNVADYHVINHEQQQLRKMMNLLETDIENTGGFECAAFSDIFIHSNQAVNRLPTNIISLGIGPSNDLSRQQITFVHPIIEEYKHTALGMIDVNSGQSNLKGVINYAPILVNAGCGQDANSPIYIGTTVLEVIPVTGITTNLANSADGTTAFIALSAVQSRRNDNSDITDPVYNPSVDDATVMFLSNNNNNASLPFGRNQVTISLGFAPASVNNVINTHVPSNNMTNLANGGWIDPFANITNYNLIVDRDPTKTPNSNLLNRTLHTDTNGSQLNTFPLSENAIRQIRAIKFQFQLDMGTDRAKTVTRVIRFKNTHLMKLR